MRVADQFQEIALRKGRALVASTPEPWLTSRGHLAIAGQVPDAIYSSLQSIFDLLDGDEAVLAAKRRRLVSSDFRLGQTQVEFDEKQHFTFHRLATFAVYPAEAPLGFDVAEYAKLCLRLGKRAERAFAHRDALEFPGPYGRARQRAYFDAFRDLVAPCFGNGPLIRVPAPNRDPQAALQALEAALARLDRQPA